MVGDRKALGPAQPETPRTTSVLGINVSRVDYSDATSLIISWAHRREPRLVSALAVHGVMTGVLDPRHGDCLNSFDLLAPDGQPVRWALNLLDRRAPRLADRVYGPELVRHVCAAAAHERVGVYLYGSTDATVHAMARQLQAWYPTLEIAGIRPSRFRDATPHEDEDDINAINASEAGIVLVGLGCPLQERWAYEHRERVEAVMLCVGAAFDFHAGRLRQAPGWMQRNGLEWLFRLWTEPWRLWRRYLLLNPAYVVLLALQLMGREPRRGPRGAADTPPMEIR